MSDPSPLDRTRRRYREMARGTEQHLHLPIRRATDGDLVCRYREPGWEEVEETAERWAAKGVGVRDKLCAQAEILALALVDIYQRDDDHEGAVELERVPGGDKLPGRYLPGLGLDNGTMTFDAAARALDLTVDEDEPIVAVFAVMGGGKVGDWEVDAHSKIVQRFEAKSSPEVDDDFAGESPAATLS